MKKLPWFLIIRIAHNIFYKNVRGKNNRNQECPRKKFWKSKKFKYRNIKNGNTLWHINYPCQKNILYIFYYESVLLSVDIYTYLICNWHYITVITIRLSRQFCYNVLRNIIICFSWNILACVRVYVIFYFITFIENSWHYSIK